MQDVLVKCRILIFIHCLLLLQPNSIVDIDTVPIQKDGFSDKVGILFIGVGVLLKFWFEVKDNGRSSVLTIVRGEGRDTALDGSCRFANDCTIIIVVGTFSDAVVIFGNLSC